LPCPQLAHPELESFQTLIVVIIIFIVVLVPVVIIISLTLL